MARFAAWNTQPPESSRATVRTSPASSGSEAGGPKTRVLVTYSTAGILSADVRKARLVIDDEVAPLARRVFEEYATGNFSTRDIARRLNAEGAVLPRFTGGWRADTVAQLLDNVA
jgi:Recombinase